MSIYRINIDCKTLDKTYKELMEMSMEEKEDYFNKKDELFKIIISKEEEYNINNYILDRLVNLFSFLSYSAEVIYMDRIVISVKKVLESPKIFINSEDKTKDNEVYNKFKLIDVDFEYCDSEEEFRGLLHLVKFMEIDKIFYVDRDDMLDYKYIDFNKKKRKIYVDDLREKDIYTEIPVYHVSQLMGCYIKISDDEIGYKKYFKDIGKKIETYDENIICICKDNIIDFSEKLVSDFKIYIDFFELTKYVLIHEFGHLVFSYLNLKKDFYNENKIDVLKEKQANYFASFYFNSKYDYEIKEITNVQPMMYSNPILLSHRINDSKVYENNVRDLYIGKY